MKEYDGWAVKLHFMLLKVFLIEKRAEEYIANRPEPEDGVKANYRIVKVKIQEVE